MVWGTAFVINIVLVTIALNPRYNSLLLAVLAPLLMMGASALFTSYYTKIPASRPRLANGCGPSARHGSARATGLASAAKGR